MINYKPTFSNVVVKEPFISNKTTSGIIKPESLTKEEKETLNKLEVVAVGDAVASCKVGDFISVSRFGVGQVTPIELSEERYLVFHESIIIGVYIN